VHPGGMKTAGMGYSVAVRICARVRQKCGNLIISGRCEVGFNIAHALIEGVRARDLPAGRPGRTEI